VSAAGPHPAGAPPPPSTPAPFRGPYADGPPPDALHVDVPSLGAFRSAELRRMALICTLMVLTVARALAAEVVRRRVRVHRPRPADRRPTRSWAEVGAHGLVDAFILLGPTFVKLGQVMASSPAMFPEPLPTAARRCLDAVPPFDGAVARRMVAEDLGRPVEEVFASFDDRPLSAASIGQVHACTLPDGREAVVKVQRPDICERMQVDLRIMFRLARAFERTRWGRTASAVAAICDLHATACQELNPVLEAWNQERFRARIGAFGDNRWVTAPEVHWDRCGPRMICMERVRGTPMDDTATIRARGVDGELVLRRGAKVWAEAVVVHGPFHGDMHAGNIWVLDDGRACFLDFGIMGELAGEWRRLVCDLFYTCMFDRDFSRVAAAYRRVGVFPPDVGTDEEIGGRLALVLGPLLDRGFEGLDMGVLIAQSVALMQAYDAVAPQELMLVAKQLLYIERYTKSLAPDYVLVADPFIVRNIFPEEAAAKAAALGVEMPE
jgi:predicted unusual protein kinase regulating ubiquinone biosynthesis (AarF/ABC1/UbiB family)